MQLLAQIFVGSDYFLQTLVSWSIAIVVLTLSLGFWFMWWYLNKKSKS